MAFIIKKGDAFVLVEGLPFEIGLICFFFCIEATETNMLLGVG